MPTTNEHGYLIRRTTKSGRTQKSKSFRNWWLIKWKNKEQGFVALGNVTFPKDMVGKKVVFKMEIMEDKHNERKTNRIQ